MADPAPTCLPRVLSKSREAPGGGCSRSEKCMASFRVCGAL